MNPSIERVIRKFVAKRIDFIKTGNREGLDSTYDLFRRNDRNCHDYDWYIRQIEFGFGAEVQKFEIQEVTNETPLPFSNLVTYPWPPEYIVFLTTVNQRRTIIFRYINLANQQLNIDRALWRTGFGRWLISAV